MTEVVESRRESRLKPNQSATVNVLGIVPGPEFEATVLDISGSGVRLRGPMPVPCGTSVKILVNNVLSHGIVRRCEPGQDEYVLGVQISVTAPVEDSVLR